MPLHLDPNNAYIYFNKGSTLYNLKRYEEALATYDQTILLDPIWAIAYNGKGFVLELLKKLEEAQKYYQKARQLGYGG